MRLFKKKKKSPENPDNSIENLGKLVREYSSEILKLEKEVVFWKEKALNFKRFHQ